MGMHPIEDVIKAVGDRRHSPSEDQFVDTRRREPCVRLPASSGSAYIGSGAELSRVAAPLYARV